MQEVKYYFVINPNAGRRREQKRLRQNIDTVTQAAGLDVTVYDTVCRNDGGEYMKRMVRQEAEACGGDLSRMPELRFYFGGGDGTVLEAACAFMTLPDALRHGKVAVGIMPIGTGNDFLRNFGTARDFLDIERQLRAEQRFVDLMAYEKTQTAVGDGANEAAGNSANGTTNSGENDAAEANVDAGETAATVDSGAGPEPDVKYCANMFNIGFDCQVVVRVNELRGRPYMTKNLAYPIGVAHTLVKLPHTQLKVTADDGVVHEGKFLLTLAANGSYCGGGFYAASEANPFDSLMDVMLIKPLSRLQFISIVGKYKKGKLLGTKLGDRICTLLRTHTVSIQPVAETDLCADGEIERFSGVNITAVPRAFCFLVPENSVPEAQTKVKAKAKTKTKT